MTYLAATEEAALRLAQVLCALLVCSCGAAPLSELRFHNHDPIRSLDDRRPTNKPAKNGDAGLRARAFESAVNLPIRHGLSAEPALRAQNVNALDEVPDSTWFENRIGQHAIAPELLENHPDARGPDRSAPLVVEKVKQQGAAPGFVIRDARGDRYLLKFDQQHAETETGAEVVVQRLLWAAGYHVPANSVIFLARSELIADVASVEQRAMSNAALDRVLAAVPEAGRGTYRALASKFLPGKPLGPYAMTGVRSDDPHDRVPHEHRRELRGQRLFFAWLLHTDVKDANTLDMWIESPEGSGRGYVTHHVLDFGKALGVWGRAFAREWDGWTPQVDYESGLFSLVSLGLWKRPWEDVPMPELTGVGHFEAEHFDPTRYSPANPYAPFLYADRSDDYWAARIIARFSAAHIERAVAAGRYSDPRAAAYLVRTLIARQRRALQYGFSRLNALDDFEVETRAGATLRVCTRDLLLAHHLAASQDTRYRVTSYDWDGAALGSAKVASGRADGRLCMAALPTGARRQRYTMLRFETWRGETRLPPLILHLALKPMSTHHRIVGLERH